MRQGHGQDWATAASGEHTILCVDVVAAVSAVLVLSCRVRLLQNQIGCGALPLSILEQGPGKHLSVMSGCLQAAWICQGRKQDC